MGKRFLPSLIYFDIGNNTLSKSSQPLDIESVLSEMRYTDKKSSLFFCEFISVFHTSMVKIRLPKLLTRR